MMKKILGLLILPVLTIATLAGLAHAEGETAPTGNLVDKRQANQEKRIESGVASGAISEQEAKHLEKRQKRIGQAEEKAMADGNLSKGEAKHLNRMQNRASHDIARKKHNRRGNR